MHDIKSIRDNPAMYDANWARRGLDPQTPQILDADTRHRAVIAQLQDLQTRRNSLSAQVGEIKRSGGDAAQLMADVAAMKEEMAALEDQERQLGIALDMMLLSIPNQLDATTPDGADEQGNVELRRWGTITKETGDDHVTIGERLGLLDFEGAAKLSGARFVVLTGGLARLERALGQFMLDVHTAEHGYTEAVVPLLVTDEVMRGTGQLPKFYSDQFIVARDSERERLLRNALHGLQRDSFVDDDVVETIVEKLKQAEAREDLWLIPTAEVPLTNLVREAITDEAHLPMRLTALTPCFRSEAGSAGRDTRGMLRQHQFYKVEMVSITAPEDSDAEHERMTRCAETILQRLNLPYRVMALCAGDIGFGSRKTYDLEVWLPGQQTYREISSCSNCGDFQARRMNARCRKAGERNTRFVHTLNGSGVAVGRCLIAIMENYWDGQGIVVPDALKPYMGGVARV